MNDLAYLIERSAKLNSEKTALIGNGQLLSFKEVHELSNALGWGLEELGIKKSDRVALLVPICSESVICEFALLKGGRVKVQINLDLSKEEMKAIINDSSANAIIYDSSLRDIKEELKDIYPDLIYIPLHAENEEISFESLIQQNRRENYSVHVDNQDLYQISYFTDTKGNSKGTFYNVFSKKASLNNHLIDELDITPEDAILHVDSFTLESSNKILPYFIKGAANIFMDTFSVNLFSEYVERFRVTSTRLTPMMIEELVESDLVEACDFSSLKNIEYNSMEMPVETIKKAVDVFGNIFIKVISFHDQFFSYLILTKYDHLVGLFELPNILRSAGREFTFIRTKIVNPHGNEVPIDVKGELLISCNNLINSNADEWFSTGEMAKKDERGYVYISDM